MRSNRITQAPLPKLFNVLRTIFMATPHTDVVSAAWTRPGDIGYHFSRSAWSMAVVARWYQRITGQSAVTLWVPDLYCNESLSLLRKLDVKLVFYPVDECGYPEINNFPAITQQNGPDLFMMVHYFGEPVPCDELVKFCIEHKAWLLEDAAHVLQPIAGVGEAGDCVFYSPHKHLAIPDGAMLVVRKDGPSGLARQKDSLKVLRELVDDTLRDKRRFVRATSMWLGKRVLQRLGVRSRPKSSAFALDMQAVPAFDDLAGMSSLAKRLLKQELPCIPEYATHRAHCALEWKRVTQGIVSAEKVGVKGVREAPYLAYLNAVDQDAAESIYVRLSEAGIPVSTWPDLPPEVIASTAEHSVAHRLRHTRIYMPVHQSVTAKQISTCGHRLRDVTLSGWCFQKISSKKEWENLWLGCQRKSLPQTWEYGSAKAMAEGWQVERFVVSDENARPIALFQVLIKGLPGLGGVARINRGPMMLKTEGNDVKHQSMRAIAVLVRESKRHRWWMMQIAPFVPPGAEMESTLHDMGFRKQPVCAMDSALLSLESSEEQLMMGLKGKWRNCLRKGQKLGVTVKLDKGGREHFQWLVDFYRAQQQEKGFDGTSERMLRALFTNQSQSFKFNLYIALDDKISEETSLLGMLVTLQFGDVVEYLIGATTEKGRAQQANSVLLWEAILDAKQNGCRWFDVGGLAKATPKGIADFKKGLNPEPYALVGEWRKWF
ncbi:MAG: GNAT family N-acetyltransferase [Legionellaceae bacterium]|nr:GNAT family N-acetyltransferase [Legionellaceae bacterium]